MAGLPLKRCIGVRLLLALVVMLAVPAAQAGFFDLRSMRYMIAEKRCDELATRLTALLPEADGEILQFAAQIHEHGECVQPDLEKAAALYTRAAQAGVTAARMSLVAIYARSMRDPAAALWWAAQEPGLMSDACRPAADPVKNAAGFVAELGQWPDDRLRACTYQVGVLARLSLRSARYRAVGQSDLVKVRARLVADQAAVVWSYADGREITESRLAPDKMDADPSSSAPHFGMHFNLWFYGISTLLEFGRPPVPDARWSMQYQFEVEESIRASSIPIQVGVSQ